jgi:sec-independent protein translocase protein TatA
MPQIGPLELIVILVIALVILGPKRLPSAARSVGTSIREIKGAVTLADPRDVAAERRLQRRAELSPVRDGANPVSEPSPGPADSRGG